MKLCEYYDADKSFLGLSSQYKSDPKLQQKLNNIYNDMWNWLPLPYPLSHLSRLDNRGQPS